MKRKTVFIVLLLLTAFSRTAWSQPSESELKKIFEEAYRRALEDSLVRYTLLKDAYKELQISHEFQRKQIAATDSAMQTCGMLLFVCERKEKKKRREMFWERIKYGVAGFGLGWAIIKL